MGQSGASRVVCSCRLTMRLPYLLSLLVVVTIIPVTIAEPDVFGDYFDDGMKLVDISQDAALRSCLSDGKTADKTKAAYDGCYGQGYDFDDLAKAGGDNDGLPDELEEKESCFYKKMGWVSEDNVMDEAAIAADMEGLENGIQEGFNNDIGTCIAWSGNFGKRRRREAGMEVQTQDTQDRELVPGLMDTGRRAMGWVRKLVRKVRSPGDKKPRKEKCKKKKNGKCQTRKGGRRRSGKNGKKPLKKKKKKSGKTTKKRGRQTKRRRNSANGNRNKRRKKNLKTNKNPGKRPSNKGQKTPKRARNGGRRGGRSKGGKKGKNGKQGGKKDSEEKKGGKKG